MSRVSARRFLTVILFVYAILATAIAGNLFVLWKAGELQPVDFIIREQLRTGALYNALSVGFADYKYVSYHNAAPEIVAIGTSRAMQIRKHFFVKPFYNLGGLANGPGQANVLADRLLLQGTPPKVVIFALDYWTFCQPATTRSSERPPAEAESVHDGMSQPDRYFLIYRLLIERSMSAVDLAGLVFSRHGSTDTGRIGLGARIGGSGFAPDGSIYYFARVDQIPLDRRWTEILGRMQTGTAQMIKDCTVSNRALSELKRFVDKMQAADVGVVLILAPLPGAVIEKMIAEGRYQYVHELRRLLIERYPKQFHDFFDMREIASDNEFLDGLHGGEIVYMRAVLSAAHRVGSPLHELVDERYLRTQISLWSGHAQISNGPITPSFSASTGMVP